MEGGWCFPSQATRTWPYCLLSCINTTATNSAQLFTPSRCRLPLFTHATLLLLVPPIRFSAALTDDSLLPTGPPQCHWPLLPYLPALAKPRALLTLLSLPSQTILFSPLAGSSALYVAGPASTTCSVASAYNDTYLSYLLTVRLSSPSFMVAAAEAIPSGLNLFVYLTQVRGVHVLPYMVGTCIHVADMMSACMLVEFWCVACACTHATWLLSSS